MKAIQIEKCTLQHKLSFNLGNYILIRLRQWRHNYRTRRHLSELPSHLLKDIGLERDQVAKEANKPFWR